MPLQRRSSTITLDQHAGVTGSHASFSRSSGERRKPHAYALYDYRRRDPRFGHDVTRPPRAHISNHDLATYTPEEVASIVGGSVWWVKEMARQRRVPHLRLGRAKIMFRRTDIVALMDSRAVDAVIVSPRHDPVDEAFLEQTEPTLADIARSAGVTRRGAARLRSLGT